MDLKKPIPTTESEIIEFKQSTGEWKEIIETICAFSNTKGGKIIIGVSKTGKLPGVDIGKDTIERLTNQISQNTDPNIHPRITVKNMDKKSIIVIEVKESSDHLVLAFGKPFKRVGKSTIRMTKDEYEKLILEKHKDKLYFDSHLCRGATLKDIDDEKVKWFLKKAKIGRNLNIELKISVKEILQKLNLLKDDKLTNATILLFGKEPQNFFLQAEVRCARFKGNEPVKPFIDMKIFSGNIIEQVDSALKFILEHISMKVYLAGKKEREEKYEYPPDALREAIINAICHRDYRTVGHIQIRIFDDRLEIWNPGLLPESLTLKDLKKKHKSIPRNPLIANSFFLIKFIEQWGTGTNDMINLCSEWELPEPLFEHITGDFVVTFRKEITESFLREKGLNERQIKAVTYVKEIRNITNKEYCKLNEVSKRTASNELKDLVLKEVFKITGEGKRGLRYILK
ncbi:MAG: putative DNA binding domain-containing protein [Deltaproteobacteria bacterium]|nr:putative DNA binding domain-containing protein [Deltaproteobacteria bacterium]